MKDSIKVFEIGENDDITILAIKIRRDKIIF
jgi:hypothetical protein